MNLLTELESYLKNIFRENSPQRLLHNSRINRKFGEEKACPKYRTAVHKSYLIVNSVRRMKSTTRLHI